MIKFLACIPLFACAWAGGAWLIMIAVGIIHADWIPAVPPIGYGVALTVTVLLGLRGALVGAATGALKGIIEAKS